ncbi:AI-2E family transporter [Marispirochaeta aestuarii]|uniref:AI-2E family transporter n=1 Tax=Marispirochaeta aestuarii TaxID=1963862 RepID=UPI0029C6BD78|nr:AI-2E family transporter [Marispirochaeta aestuarii]
MENRTILLLILTGALILFAYITRFFFVPIVVALTIANLFYPLHERIVRSLKGRRGAASFFTTFLIFLVVAVPVYLVAQLLVVQALDLYSFLRAYLKDPGIEGLIGQIKGLTILQRFDLPRVDWASVASRSLSQTASFVSDLINRTSAGILSGIADTFVIFFSLFFFFKDGPTMLEGLKTALPLEPRHVERLAGEFRRTSKAAVSATVIIGLIQGFIGSLTFLFVGIKAWLLWGVIMTILSIVPLVGSYLIMVPGALILLAQGRAWAAVFVLFMATAVSYGADYLLRPRLVGRDARLHDLLVFVASLGGLAVFGLMGFIVGPVIASVLVAMLNIFKEGFELPGPEDEAEGEAK